MDVHQAAISIAVSNSAGKLVMEPVIETMALTIVEYVRGASETSCGIYWIKSSFLVLAIGSFLHPWGRQRLPAPTAFSPLAGNLPA